MDEAGRPALFDAHTHFGQNDPDTFRQTPEELLAGLDLIGARGLVFPMHEPDGYGAANDAVLEAAAASGGKLTALCRVQPRDGQAALAEARRCMDAGAAGIKLHPRAEAFGMEEPVVGDLMALAHERRGVVLMHAGRGIPALGANTIRYAERFPDARLILAHCAISDLAWLVRDLPSHPNVYIDTSWWHPADILALFCLAPPGQVLWASDSPYGLPLHSVLARPALRHRGRALARAARGRVRRAAGAAAARRGAAAPRPGPRSQRAAGPAAGARRRQPDRGAGPRDRRRRSDRAARPRAPGRRRRRRPSAGRRLRGGALAARPLRGARRAAAARDGASPMQLASSSSHWCSPARRARRCRPRSPGAPPTRATSTRSAARPRAEANPWPCPPTQRWCRRSSAGWRCCAASWTSRGWRAAETRPRRSAGTTRTRAPATGTCTPRRARCTWRSIPTAASTARVTRVSPASWRSALRRRRTTSSSWRAATATTSACSPSDGRTRGFWGSISSRTRSTGPTTSWPTGPTPARWSATSRRSRCPTTRPTASSSSRASATPRTWRRRSARPSGCCARTAGSS